MNISSQIAKQLRAAYFGGNWTAVHVKDQLSNITWQQATTQVHNLNTIVKLVYHLHYYIEAVTKVLEGEPLTAKDKYSFDHPPIQSQEDWEALRDRSYKAVEKLAALIEQFPDDRLEEVFEKEQYGNYYRNFTGIIEHVHYHLGQIVLIRKILG